MKEKISTLVEGLYPQMVGCYINFVNLCSKQTIAVVHTQDGDIRCIKLRKNNKGYHIESDVSIKKELGL